MIIIKSIHYFTKINDNIKSHDSIICKQQTLIIHLVEEQIPGGVILSTRDESPGPAITPSSDWKSRPPSTDKRFQKRVVLFFKPSFIARHVAIFATSQLEIHQFEVAGASKCATNMGIFNGF